MTRFPWSIRRGAQVLEVGHVEALTEREAVDAVLRGGVKTKLVAENSYTVRVGNVHASAYGDEFERVAERVGLDDDTRRTETAPTSGGYLCDAAHAPTYPSTAAKAFDRLSKVFVLANQRQWAALPIGAQAALIPVMKAHNVDIEHLQDISSYYHLGGYPNIIHTHCATVGWCTATEYRQITVRCTHAGHWEHV